MKRYIIHGRVQGVGFRMWTQRNARELALSGWVRNVPDGSVELALAGEESSRSEMEQRLQDGPRAASVEKIELFEVGEEHQAQISEEFAILP